MAKRFDVTSPREYQDRDGNKKTSWINLGVAFEKDGRISILLNALPMPGQDGQAKLILMEPKQDGDRHQGQRSAPPARNDALDDEVPW